MFVLNYFSFFFSFIRFSFTGTILFRLKVLQEYGSFYVSFKYNRVSCHSVFLYALKASEN